MDEQWSVWLAVGILGQAVFAGRFVVQWTASEREGHSVVPGAFWWLSLVGSALLLAYAIALRDPVFVVGQSTGALIYSRNLMLRAR